MSADDFGIIRDTFHGTFASTDNDRADLDGGAQIGFGDLRICKEAFEAWPAASLPEPATPALLLFDRLDVYARVKSVWL